MGTSSTNLCSVRSVAWSVRSSALHYEDTPHHSVFARTYSGTDVPILPCSSIPATSEAASSRCWPSSSSSLLSHRLECLASTLRQFLSSSGSQSWLSPHHSNLDNLPVLSSSDNHK